MCDAHACKRLAIGRALTIGHACTSESPKPGNGLADQFGSALAIDTCGALRPVPNSQPCWSFASFVDGRDEATPLAILVSNFYMTDLEVHTVFACTYICDG
jgi:hypothetical protein